MVVIEEWRIKCMLEQIKDLVGCNRLSKSDADSIVGNLADLDKEIPTTNLEKTIFSFLNGEV